MATAQANKIGCGLGAELLQKPNLRIMLLRVVAMVGLAAHLSET